MPLSKRSFSARSLLIGLISGAALTATAAPAQAMAPVTCSTTSYNAAEDQANELSNAPKIKVVYAYAADQGNQVETYRASIQQGVSDMRDRIEAASLGQKSLRFDLSAGVCLDLGVIALPAPVGQYSGGLQSIQALLADAKPIVRATFPGYKNYAVLAGGVDGGGRADRFDDSQASASNFMNQGSNVAALGWTNPSIGQPVFSATALHEIFHNLGAVQTDAPNGQSGHCNDGADLMCLGYRQGGPFCEPQPNNDNAIDCGGDDYFNVNPAPGSYLASHWNIARDSLFLCPASACDQPATGPAIAISASSASPTVGDNVTLTASGGSAYHWRNGDSGDYLFGQTAPSGSSYSFVATSPRTITVRGFAPSGAWTEQQIQVTPAGMGPGSAPVRPPTARFTWKSAGGTRVTLDGSVSIAGTFRITRYTWDVTGDGVSDLEGQNVTHDFGDSKAHTVRLIVSDVGGYAGLASQTVQAGGSGSSTSSSPEKDQSKALLGTLATQRIKDVRSKGLKIAGTASDKGRVTIRIKVNTATKKKLRLASTTLATKTITPDSKGRFKVTIKLSAKVRAALARRPKTTLKVSVSGAATGTKAVVVRR